ncbi:hypothetical protein Q8F54_10405 (plasmid) [Leuconostoc mesenteroides]|uniref:Uncharacterized protein n=1 Tax=Lactiplantibacillus mudanjiangensis TaxID=1296538 RepID=A0A660E480_9LACO|nr:MULTISPECIES: hypothetical protein [Lactobacillaceae]WMS40731.1 hypothetical protein Q8F54_10405 [Leuconostoc mesenteroides]VDG25046.1 hypothetical protein (plasmid) [Lactobacillus paracasei subsp. paracasei 8700:2] [Lactiplantibacillus mudanjiangensis]VDG28938.1 hypothetical protein (plasmid) [Lactobacillus paracasei subsp. paracasei 8700:2] [Lactiplantibacillus mudanjiangensis]
MKKESWQGIKGSLVYEDDKAIIVDETDNIEDTEKLSKQLAEKGQPIKEVRHQLLKNSIKKNIKTDPLKLSSWFNRKYDSDNAKKTEKLESNKPTRQYKQIKNELTFFGESFLEGFLGFYGLEVDNALARYENNLQIIETQDLGLSNEKKYYLGQSNKGELKLATSELPSQQIAKEELNKFYSRQQEQVQQQSNSIKSPDEDTDTNGKE